MSVAESIRARLVASKVPFGANDSIAEHLGDNELFELELEVERAVQGLLAALVIDTERDHNTRETAARVARMFMREVFRGRYQPMPQVKDFPNVRRLDELYAVGPITVRSTCAHHLVPIIGKAWIGVIAKERIIGLSKFTRLTEWVMARPQIQEEATVQLADLIERLIDPAALAVVVRAGHFCMRWRGVRDNRTEMTTSVMRGAFRRDAAARAEFMALIRADP